MKANKNQMEMLTPNPEEIYCIYKDQPDIDAPFVVRRWDINYPPQMDNVFILPADTIDDARRNLPEGLVNVGRKPGDDPGIVECWVPRWMYAMDVASRAHNGNLN